MHEEQWRPHLAHHIQLHQLVHLLLALQLAQHLHTATRCTAEQVQGAASLLSCRGSGAHSGRGAARQGCWAGQPRQRGGGAGELGDWLRTSTCLSRVSRMSWIQIFTWEGKEERGKGNESTKVGEPPKPVAVAAAARAVQRQAPPSLWLPARPASWHGDGWQQAARTSPACQRGQKRGAATKHRGGAQGAAQLAAWQHGIECTVQENGKHRKNQERLTGRLAGHRQRTLHRAAAVVPAGAIRRAHPSTAARVRSENCHGHASQAQAQAGPPSGRSTSCRAAFPGPPRPLGAPPSAALRLTRTQ